MSDPLWPLHRAERSALVTLNVPHFVSPSDGNEIRDATGVSVHSEATSGLDRARARVRSFDEQEIAWQVEVIRQNTSSISRTSDPPAGGVERKQLLRGGRGMSRRRKRSSLRKPTGSPRNCPRYAIRRGPSAAWIGLDWLGDSEVFQLVSLGPDLYNGVSGIAVFLAAHAAVTGRKSSGELALAGMSHLRKELKGRNAARMARSLGIGGATGLGSIVYALDRDVEEPARRGLARGRPGGGEIVHRRPDRGRQAARRDRRQRRRHSWPSSPLSRHAIRRRARRAR